MASWQLCPSCQTEMTAMATISLESRYQCSKCGTQINITAAEMLSGLRSPRVWTEPFTGERMYMPPMKALVLPERIMRVQPWPANAYGRVEAAVELLEQHYHGGAYGTPHADTQVLLLPPREWVELDTQMRKMALYADRDGFRHPKIEYRSHSFTLEVWKSGAARTPTEERPWEIVDRPQPCLQQQATPEEKRELRWETSPWQRPTKGPPLMWVDLPDDTLGFGKTPAKPKEESLEERIQRKVKEQWGNNES